MDKENMALNHGPDSDKVSTREELCQAFGGKLRELRESRGLSLTTLANETRINRPFIEALEAGDLDKLPGDVFGRGFIRVICKFMRVDEYELLRDFELCWDKSRSSNEVIKNHAKVQTERKKVARAAAKRQVSMLTLAGKIGVPSLVGLSIIYAVIGRQIRSDEKVATPAASGLAAQVTDAKESKEPVVIAAVAEKKNEAEAQAASAPTPSPAAEAVVAPGAVNLEPSQVPPLEKPTSEPPPQVKSIILEPGEPQEITANAAHFEQVIEIAVSYPVRLRMTLDRGAPEVKELKQETYTFRFQEKAELLVYDAAAVKIKFNGRALGQLGSKGRVRRLSFAAKVPGERTL